MRALEVPLLDLDLEKDGAVTKAASRSLLSFGERGAANGGAEAAVRPKPRNTP